MNSSKPRRLKTVVIGFSVAYVARADIKTYSFFAKPNLILFHPIFDYYVTFKYN